MFNKVGLFALELTNYCNLDCTFCANRLMNRPKGFMDLSIAKRLIEEVKISGFCDAIATNVMGEPLLYPHLPELLEFAKGKKIPLTVITNGQALDGDIGKILLSSLIKTICISVQSHDQKSFEFKGRGGDYETYKKKLEDFIRLKYILKSKPNVGLHFMSTGSRPTRNFRILHTPSDFKELSDTWLSFARRLNEELHLKFSVPNELFPGSNRLLPGFYVSILRDYQTWSGDVCENDFIVTPRKSTCFCPFTQFVVLWNGDTTLCCIDYNGDLVYDNVRNKSISEVFNSDKIQKIRTEFLNLEEMPKKCQRCQGSLQARDVNLGNPEIVFPSGFFSSMRHAKNLFKQLLDEGSLLKFALNRIFTRTSFYKKWQRNKWERLNCQGVKKTSGQ